MKWCVCRNMEIKLVLGLLMVTGIFSQGFESLAEKNISQISQEIIESSDLHVRKKRIIDESTDRDEGVLRQEIPYVVRILDEKKEIHCTGTILGPRIVLTAAHCVAPKKEFFISTGSIILKTVKFHTVERILVHQDYNSVKKKNDLALFVLNDPIDFVQSRHRPIELYEGNLPADSHGLVSGWGSKTRAPLVFPLQPHSIKVSILSWQECQRALSKRFSITPHEICTFHTNRTRCCWHADSGGPLVVQGRLVGIFSWFIGNPQLHVPDVFMNLLDPEYKSWVRSWVSRIERAHQLNLPLVV